MTIFAALFSCRNRSRLGKSVHFHPPADDSVHVMLKHDMKRHREKGEAQKAYSARKPLSEILAAQQAIQATEDDDQISDDVANADKANHSQ